MYNLRPILLLIALSNFPCCSISHADSVRGLKLSAGLAFRSAPFNIPSIVTVNRSVRMNRIALFCSPFDGNCLGNHIVYMCSRLARYYSSVSQSQHGCHNVVLLSPQTNIHASMLSFYPLKPTYLSRCCPSIS